MSAFGSILSIARNAIVAHQAAMQTVSHNIANAQTAGYSRQRTELAAHPPLLLPFGSIGTGVEIADITRARDTLLDASFRRENATTERFQMRHELLGEIEGILNEPSENGLASTMDAFWNSWADLSNNPGSSIAQGVVRQRGAQVAWMFNTYSTRIDDLVNRTRDRLVLAVGEVNALAGQVALLNGQITAAESGGNQAPDLRDARDRIADDLSKLGVARAEPQADGTLSVYVGGIAIVSGTAVKPLEVRVGTALEVGVVGDPSPLRAVGGSLKTMLDFVNTDAPGVRARLDALARGLVNGVNEYHASGWTASGDALGGANWNPLAGPTGSRVNFFDATGTTARSMVLSSEVLADITVIASGDAQNAPGNNAIALALAALREDGGMDALRTRLGANFGSVIGFPAGTTYAEHYRATTSDLGVQVADADQQHTTYEVLTELAEHRRQSVSGVSLDEELTRMMQYQQAFVAAARIVRAVEEMTQSLLTIV